MSAYDRGRRGITDRGSVWSYEDALRILRENYRNAVRAADHVRRARAWTALSAFVDKRHDVIRTVHLEQDRVRA